MSRDDGFSVTARQDVFSQDSSKSATPSQEMYSALWPLCQRWQHLSTLEKATWLSLCPLLSMNVLKGRSCQTGGPMDSDQIALFDVVTQGIYVPKASQASRGIITEPWLAWTWIRSASSIRCGDSQALTPCIPKVPDRKERRFRAALVLGTCSFWIFTFVSRGRLPFKWRWYLKRLTGMTPQKCNSRWDKISRLHWT